MERVKLDNGGERETTVKEYAIGADGAVWLLPRSSRPEFQTPVRLATHDDEEVRICAVVIGSYRPTRAFGR